MVKMMYDLTYSEIQLIKDEISEFIKELKKYSLRGGVNLTENEISYFTFITKRIIFLEYIINNYRDSFSNYYKTIMSDYFNMIVAIIDRKKRYIYFSERSIIENYIRIVLKLPVERDHVTYKCFSNLKENFENKILTTDNYALIRNEYRVCCEYIHGPKNNTVLSEFFMDCLSKEKDNFKYNQYFNRIQEMIKILDKLYFYSYPSLISDIFYRKKSIIDYLFGKEYTDMLFYENNEET